MAQGFSFPKGCCLVYYARSWFVATQFTQIAAGIDQIIPQKMNSRLLMTLFMSVFTISYGQIPVESCISYDTSENPMLNIKWNTESVDVLNNIFIVLYGTAESDVLTGDNCIEGNNRTNISIEGEINYVTEVGTTLRDFCNPTGPNVPIQNGSSIAEYGYISNLERVSSEDNSTINFTCHLACQTDFITGCNITLVDACGKNFTQSCTVENSQTFSPRQCSVVFQDIPPSQYEFMAKVQSNSPLQREENILNITGTFVTVDDNFSCEPDEINNNITNTNNNATTNSSNIIPANDNVDDDNNSNSSDNETSNSDDGDDFSMDNNPSNNTTADSQDDDNILDRIKSLPVPVLASIGAAILIMIIVVILLLILFCRMKKSNKKDKSHETGIRTSPTVCDSFTFQNSTTALFGGPPDSCTDVKSDVQTFSEAFGGNVSKSSSYDHLAKSFKPKQPSPLSHQSSCRSQFTDDSSVRNSDGNKTAQSYESSVVTKDEELLDDFDYDEIDDTPTTHTRTQYNNLVHSGKEHRLKIECPPAPTTGTYERLSQPPSEDNYAVPPELDDVDFKLKENLKSNHDYDEVPPELILSGTDISADATYDRLSPKPDNTYDQVAKGFEYNVPVNNTTNNFSNGQYDTLLPKPKPPVVENQSGVGSHSDMTKRQPSPVTVQHNPGPVTGDMYTVPKKFEIKSKSSHEYDTVVDTFGSQSTVF